MGISGNFYYAQARAKFWRLDLATRTQTIIGFAAVGLTALALTPRDHLPDGATAATVDTHVSNHPDLAAISAAKAAGAAIRESSREPNSIVFDEMRVSADGKTICAVYRGRNGFGGMSRQFTIFRDGTALKNLSAWKRICHRPMKDWSLIA
jgi:hypothetical protein